jgi:hypothetical protein
MPCPRRPGGTLTSASQTVRFSARGSSKVSVPTVTPSSRAATGMRRRVGLGLRTERTKDE